MLSIDIGSYTASSGSEPCTAGSIFSIRTYASDITDCDPFFLALHEDKLETVTRKMFAHFSKSNQLDSFSKSKLLLINLEIF